MNIQAMMKQAQAMQKDMLKIKDEVDNTEFTGESSFVKVILKADKQKNPKLSYTVGKDAFFACLISKLPQCVINKLIKLGMKIRMR